MQTALIKVVQQLPEPVKDETTGLTNYSPVSKKSLPVEMQKIYELVKEATPVSRLTTSLRSKMIKALLLRITMITGWIVPEDEMFNILADQFGKICCEQYAGLNDQEIEYAIRQYGINVQDWGKEINLALIHQALEPYISLRREVSRWEENQHRPDVKQLAAPETIEDGEEECGKENEVMQEWYDAVSQQLIQGMDLIMLPPMLYDWLDRTGKIEMDKQQKFAYMDEAAKRIEQRGEAPEVEKVKTFAKRLALNDYILKQYKKSVINITEK